MNILHIASSIASLVVQVFVDGLFERQVYCINQSSIITATACSGTYHFIPDLSSTVGTQRGGAAVSL